MCGNFLQQLVMMLYKTCWRRPQGPPFFRIIALLNIRNRHRCMQSSILLRQNCTKSTPKSAVPFDSLNRVCDSPPV